MEKLRKIFKGLRSRKGFTLIELMITVIISIIIMAAVFEVYIAQKRGYIREGKILELENAGHFTMEYLTRTVQNSGYNIKNGMKIESASDHYFTAVMDENDDGVIEMDEVITLAVNTPYFDVPANSQPTEIIHDPALNNLASGGPHEYYMDVYFDMDGDGEVSSSEMLLCGYNLDDGADDSNMGQMDAIKLHLNGPPYSLYRYTFRLHDESSAFDATTNPYIVNPKPDTIVDNVDNFVIKYYDEENLPLPVTLDSSGNRITPKPPYYLSRVEMGKIRRMEFDLLIRSSKEDPKWNDEGAYPVGTVATYEAGEPKDWTCGDSGFRDQEPFLTDCAGLTDWECFNMSCNIKVYPTYGETIVYADHYRRLFLNSSATPKNLVLDPYGRLSLSASPKKIRCPDVETELTATLKDKEGAPIANTIVTFYATANLSQLDFSGVSNTDADGNPITDANGEVSGIKLRPDAPPDKDKKPTTITVSADSSITVNIDGIDKVFPVYSSIVVPFIVGPPSTVTIDNPPTSEEACDDSRSFELAIYAEDCNGFKANAVEIVMSFFDGSTDSALGSNHVPGRYFIMEAGPTRNYLDTPPYIAVEDPDVDGKYSIWYEPPEVMSSTETYPKSLGIKVEATKFEDKPLDIAEPDGWGMTIPNYTTKVALETGIRPFSMDVWSGDTTISGCQGNYFSFSALGYDCGGYSIYQTDRYYEIHTDIGPSSPTYGALHDPENIETALDPTYMKWESEGKFSALYYISGCSDNAGLTETLTIIPHNKKPSGSPYSDPTINAEIINATLNICSAGLDLVLWAEGANGETVWNFFENGCEYENLDVVANLTLTGATPCQDLSNNPVVFTIISGDAKFWNSGASVYNLTTVTVNTNSEGKAIIDTGLVGGNCSISDVVIKADAEYGGSPPTYTATKTFTLGVAPDSSLFSAYRDYCYTKKLYDTSYLWTGDTIYIEIRDCCRNAHSNSADTLLVTVKAYENVNNAPTDSEEITLTETGNETGVFRGSIESRGIPGGWTTTNNDGILDTSNANYINATYVDASSVEHELYDGNLILAQAIVDNCAEGIRFKENFTKIANDGLDAADKAKFPFFNVNSSYWAGFSTANLTESSSPALVPSAETFKYLVMQYCDEFFISGSIPFKSLWDSSLGTLFPPTTAPPLSYTNSETFIWVDLDESIVGEDYSESSWGDYTLNLRFKFIASPSDSGYQPTDEVNVGDYYFPSSVDEGVIFIFRASSSEDTLSGLTGQPMMHKIDRGYFLVWTKDSSGDPLIQLFRVSSEDWGTNPVELESVQIGNDITSEAPHNFTMNYDDGEYHRLYATFDGEYFDIWIDNYKLDFGTASNHSGSDRNFSTGTIGFGVKNGIAKFDNIQICGCPVTMIKTTDDTFPEGVEVTLTMEDVISGYPAVEPINWTVFPTNAGVFKSPTNETSVVFERGSGDPFPEYFTATDANDCVANRFEPTPSCFLDDFEADKGYVILDPPGSNWTICHSAWWRITNFNGSQAVEKYGTDNWAGVRMLVLNNPAAEPYWQTSVDHSTGIVTGTYDNYSVDADIYFNNGDDYPDGGTNAGMFVRYEDCTHYYTVLLRNCDSCGDGGSEVRLARYNGWWSYRFGVNIIDDENNPAFPTDTRVHLRLDVEDNKIRMRVYDSSGNLYDSIGTSGTDSGSTVNNTAGKVDYTWTDSSDIFKTGQPGFRTYHRGAKFDNFEVCPK